MVIDMTPKAATSEWIFLGSRDTMTATVTETHRMVVAHDARRMSV
jgi:hypothetical protein